MRSICLYVGDPDPHLRRGVSRYVCHQQKGNRHVPHVHALSVVPCSRSHRESTVMQTIEQNGLSTNPIKDTTIWIAVDTS